MGGVGTGPGAEVGTWAGRGAAAAGPGGEMSGRKSRAAPMAGVYPQVRVHVSMNSYLRCISRLVSPWEPYTRRMCPL